MTRFTIPDMDCEGCVGSIRRAIAAKDQTATISANLATHILDITSALDAPTLAGIIDAAGFSVEAG